MESTTSTTIVEETQNVLDILAVVFDFMIGQLSTLVDVIMENPLLLIPIGVVLTYTIISVFKSLF